MLNSSSSLVVKNSVFVNNRSKADGGVMYNSVSSKPTITNCTFLGNSSGNNGGFMYNDGSSIPVITNCIIRSNLPQTSSYYNANTTNTSIVTHSLIQSGFIPANTATSDGTNIQAQAQFVNQADLDGPDGIFGTADDGLALTICSPAINAGINSALSAGDTLDVKGARRVQGGTVGMGAYETTPPSGTEAQLAGTIGNAHTVPSPLEIINDTITSLIAPNANGTLNAPATISWEKSTTSEIILR